MHHAFFTERNYQGIQSHKEAVQYLPKNIFIKQDEQSGADHAKDRSSSFISHSKGINPVH